MGSFRLLIEKDVNNLYQIVNLDAINTSYNGNARIIQHSIPDFLTAYNVALAQGSAILSVGHHYRIACDNTTKDDFLKEDLLYGVLVVNEAYL